MGISFKVSKTGTRFRPRAPAEESAGRAAESPAPAGSKRQINTAETVSDVNGDSILSACSGGIMLPEHEVSFTLNLFHKGFFIGKPSEELSPLHQDIKSLHPYDRVSETMFSAIESGWLPGDILDDIPSKYFYGTLICEVRDYTKCIPEQGIVSSLSHGIPVINRIRLRMSLENVVKDIPLISDDNWTYSDLMEAESRILKALRPQLCLDPTPMLDRLCHDTVTTKFNLGIGKKRRLRQTPDVTVTSNSQTHGKKVCIDGLPENADYKPGGSGHVVGDSALQSTHENAAVQHVSSGHPSARTSTFPHEMAKPALPLSSQSKCQPIVNYGGVMHGVGSPANFIGANTNISSTQNLMNSYTDAVNSSVSQPGKREGQDHLTARGGIKRTKHTQLGLDSIQQQQDGPQFGLSGADLPWKNPLLPPQLDVKGMQYSTLGGQRYPSQVINNMTNQESGVSFSFNQGMRYGPKEEQIDTKLDEKTKDPLHALVSENNSLDQQARSQQLSQQISLRNHLPPHTQWQNSRASADKDMRKDDMLQKRKSVNSPRVSSGPMVQSPVSSKSGEISSGSVGGQFSAAATTSALGSQKDKATANSNIAVGAPSVTSSPSDSLQRQNHTSVTAKRKANSISKTQVMSGVGSPASVSNMNPPLNANSPSIGTAPMGDQVILDRFLKIEMIVQRHHLNMKKTKVDSYSVRKPMVYSSEKVAFYLNNSENADDMIDPIKPLSKSIIGDTVNTYKTRLLNFIRPERMFPAISTRCQNRLIMHEKPIDGTVAMQHGDNDDSDYSNAHDCLLTLPTSHDADLLAAQYIKLMERDGFNKTEDNTRMQSRMSTPNPVGMLSDNAVSEVKHLEVASGQHSNVPAISNSNNMGSLCSSQNLPNNARLLASGNSSQASVISQGFMPGAAMPMRTQQVEQPLIQPQQQQLQLQQNQQSQMQQQQLPLPHLQRSPSLLSTNPLSQLMGQNSNLQMGSNPMVSKAPNHLQLQMLQQQAQQQQQQQTQLPRKMMMNLGAAVGVGNMASNMIGLGGLSNVMGMGGVRGMSSPMGPISGLGNISPNQMNLGTTSNFGAGLRPGSMPAVQAAAMAKLRMATQNRTGMYGQSGIAGLPGNSNQMLPSSAGLSMLGHALNRANMNPLQRNAMASMGPPKIPGANFYLNAQQQLQLQQHQQLQQQQQQQQQQLQQQQQQQLQQQQQQLQQQQQIQQQQQQISSPLQQAQVGSPPVVGSPQAMVMQQHQISPQQIGQQTAMSPQQLSSGALQHLNNNNAGAPPASPQLSSQTHGSVGSITSSPMEQLQGAANKGGPVSNV